MGCDKKLGSSVKFDRCGVCDGDGLTCVTGSERSNIADTSNSAGMITAKSWNILQMILVLSHIQT